VSTAFVIELIAGANGKHHRSAPHHAHASVEVHTLIRSGWYVKF
jgi:hypothetical protein